MDSPTKFESQSNVTSMETALQVDLARPEAPADQVLESALGQDASQPRPGQASLSSNDASSNDAKRSARGRTETTHQIRLVPKSSQDHRSRSRSTQRAPGDELELRDSESTTNSYTLQPVDEGFGAWSYAVSAFAMFVVVWGKWSNLEHCVR